MNQKLSKYNIIIKEKLATNSGDLSEKMFRRCNFCDKACVISTERQQITEKLCGKNSFFCTFCIRHGLHTNINKKFLMLSFRSVFAYLYFNNYCSSDFQKIWLSDLEKIIKDHEKVGLSNPLFLYDPQTFLWFINFSKIGNSKKAVSINCVFETIKDILESFNLQTHTSIDIEALFEKYKKGIKEFYKKRYRFDDNFVLIPTLKNTGVQELTGCSYEDMTYFMPFDMIIK